VPGFEVPGRKSQAEAGAHGFTTRMIDRLASKYNLLVYETPVGFNYTLTTCSKRISRRRANRGISFRGHIPEGDGLLMGLLLLKMVATWSLAQRTGRASDRYVGLAYYQPATAIEPTVAKDQMTQDLLKRRLEIGGEKVEPVL
jgi:phosphomannomutase